VTNQGAQELSAPKLRPAVGVQDAASHLAAASHRRIGGGFVVTESEAGHPAATRRGDWSVSSVKELLELAERSGWRDRRRGPMTRAMPLTNVVEIAEGI
jgi:hypothetical protein